MVSGALFCLGGGGLDIIFRGHYFCWVGVVGHYFWGRVGVGALFDNAREHV